jgi:hypothetical protein
LLGGTNENVNGAFINNAKIGIRGSIFCVICVALDITNPFVLALRRVVYFSVSWFSLYQKKELKSKGWVCDQLKALKNQRSNFNLKGWFSQNQRRGYLEPIFSKPETGHSLNQNPRLGGCLILETFKELPNIGLFIKF